LGVFKPIESESLDVSPKVALQPGICIGDVRGAERMMFSCKIAKMLKQETSFFLFHVSIAYSLLLERRRYGSLEILRQLAQINR
jgi:hypothetical protein